MLKTIMFNKSYSGLYSTQLKTNKSASDFSIV